MTDLEACPKCGSIQRVKRKLVLIDRGNPDRLKANWRVSCGCEGDLSVSDLRPEFVQAGSTGQFIQGLYCELCDVGYVPEFMAKGPAPSYRLYAGGWRRVYEDGALGPLLERIADDPDSSAA